MRVSRQKLEEFARRHGFDSFQNMKDDAVRKKLEQKDQPDSELAQAAQDALTLNLVFWKPRELNRKFCSR